MIMISRGLKERVLTKLKIIYQVLQNQSDVRKRRGRNAVMRDVPIMLLMEEYVSDMVPKLRLASMRDVTIML